MRLDGRRQLRWTRRWGVPRPGTARSVAEMSSVGLLLAVASLPASALLTMLVCRLAVAHGVLDIPNERSSHSSATPRGGGVAIVVTTTAGLLVLAAHGAVSRDLCMALVGGGIVVAVVGF